MSGPNGARTRRALQIDSSVPSSARVWNYWQGGKDHYEVDRVAAEAYRTIAPSIKTMARESRAFLSRAVTFATAELGVRQFLDVGTGLPAGENTHEIAQRIAPQTKVVYVDSDPLVLVHARALLRSTPEGAVLHLPGDLHEPEPILAAAAATFLDFNQPIALLLMGVLGHIQNYDEACLIVRRLMTALPVGSCLIHYDAIATPKLTLAQIAYNTTGAIPYALRTADQIAAFYEGLDVLAPGIVPCSLWRPHPGHRPAATDIHGGIARKL
ncbi:SAM-dependent methyltransferase [Streptomyces griseorubiginosus]|uniref:SAM-dependent methyltransferase n=1 Tax=Streptomyces griseorubiginosus TaxID=67304 RepID=UPI0033D41806